MTLFVIAGPACNRGNYGAVGQANVIYRYFDYNRRMTQLDTISGLLKTEWAVISQAPINFVAAVTVATMGVWAFVRHQYSERFETTKHSLAMMAAQKDIYREQLEVEQKKTALLLDRQTAGPDSSDNAQRTVNDVQPIRQANATDWGQIRYRFENLTGRSISAMWIEDVNSITFSVTGGSEDDRLDAEALCRVAGKMLRESPRVIASVPVEIVSETDYLRRWLLWLKERDHLTPDAEGQDETAWHGGYIRDLIRASTRACTDCMTYES